MRWIGARPGINGVVSHGPDGSIVQGMVMEVDVMLVYESAQEPDSIEKKLLVNCGAQQYTETFSSAIWRNDRMSQVPLQGWHPLNAPWQIRAAQFACSPASQITQKTGFLPLPPSVRDQDLVKFTWDTLWKDGTRPPYTTTRTKKQVQAQLEQLQKQARQTQAKASQIVQDSYLHGAATPGERLRMDLAQDRSNYLAAQENTRRRANTFNPRMETWVGATEQQIVSGWGQPNSFSTDANGDRLLGYVSGSTTDVMNGAGALVGSYAYECHITWVIQNGIATTYHWHATDGTRHSNSCYQVSIGTGPFPGKQY